MKLIKLTSSYSHKDVYIDLEKITCIQEYDNSLHGNTNIGCTEILVQGNQFIVKEHITEIIAIIEGRDPRPAQILYGKKK